MAPEVTTKVNPNTRGKTASLLTGIDYNESGSKATDFGVSFALVRAKTPLGIVSNRVIGRLLAGMSVASAFQLDRDVSDMELRLKIVANTRQ